MAFLLAGVASPPESSLIFRKPSGVGTTVLVEFVAGEIVCALADPVGGAFGRMILLVAPWVDLLPPRLVGGVWLTLVGVLYGDFFTVFIFERMSLLAPQAACFIARWETRACSTKMAASRRLLPVHA